MADKLLKYIPKTLQEDFVDNKVVPFIGAGFSKNAIMLDGTDILDWNGLGRAMAAYIPNYDYTNAIDALSLFESEFSRTKLIEVMAKELKIYYLNCLMNYNIELRELLLLNFLMGLTTFQRRFFLLFRLSILVKYISLLI